MAEIPSIDYTNKDYDSLRRAMLDLARWRLPEWTDQSPADLGMLLVDLFAYMGDVVLYYQDRIANESFLHTAVERRSIVNHLRAIGYELTPPVAASADLLLTFDLPASGSTLVAVPRGALFQSSVPADDPQSFEYLGPDLAIDLASDQVAQSGTAGKVVYTLPVRQSRAVPTETVGSSTDEPNQAFALAKSPPILETLVVEVDEGAGWIAWDRRESFLYNLGADGRVQISSAQARDYMVQFDDTGRAWILFGDGVYGRRPPGGTNNIRATYRVGGGRAGNVPAGTIIKAITKVPRLSGVTNPVAAAGGEDAEGNDHAVRFGPLAFRSLGRAVTLDDYVALAFQAGGVAKVRALSGAWNSVEMVVAPEGERCGPVPEGLRARLLAYFENKRMAGTTVRILDPGCVLVDVGLDVLMDAHYQQETVRQGVFGAVTRMLAFANVDFGQTIYQSDVYALIEAVPGVLAVTLTRFRRSDSPLAEIEDELLKANLPPLAQLPVFMQEALRTRKMTEGRIELGPFEIPVLGELEIRLRTAGR
jgi:hypothetical protein